MCKFVAARPQVLVLPHPRRVFVEGGCALAAWLLVPGARVHASNHRLIDRFFAQMDDLFSRVEPIVNQAVQDAPVYGRRAVENAFESRVIGPLTQELAAQQPPADPLLRDAVQQALQVGKGFVGDAAQETLSGLLDRQTFRQIFSSWTGKNSARFGQPSFHYAGPTGFDIDPPKLPSVSTSQPLSDMLGRARDRQFPVRFGDISLSWKPFSARLASRYDVLSVSTDIEARQFLEDTDSTIPRFSLRRGNISVGGQVNWTCYQNGAINHLSVGLGGTLEDISIRVGGGFTW